MEPEEFIQTGEILLRDIAQYLQNPEAYPVLSQVRPGDIKSKLPASPPASGESMEAIREDFQNILMPGMTHWNHPGFMAYFANSSPGPGILMETLSAALNQNAMLWRTSPAATELEEVVVAWVASMLGLEGMTGVITDTASISSFLAISAAREVHAGVNVRMEGLSGSPRLRVYCSDQAHSSIDKAIIALGIGLNNLRKIPCDAEFRMDPAALESAILEDKEQGLIPCCVVATVGTTSSTSIDPVAAIADICRSEGIWLHVDAAYAGTAAILPEFRWVLDGCERADSLVMNPHKWMFTPMDCSLLYLRNPHALKQTYSLTPEYLKNSGDVTNYMDWGIQLGRRFRALKLWAIIRYFGVDGIRALLDEHIKLAQGFAAWVRETEGFEQMAPSKLSVVCFRAHPKGMDDELELERVNGRLLEAINASGKVFLSHTKLAGKYTLRVAIGNIGTGGEQVETVKSLLTDLTSEISL